MHTYGTFLEQKRLSTSSASGTADVLLLSPIHPPNPTLAPTVRPSAVQSDNFTTTAAIRRCCCYCVASPQNIFTLNAFGNVRLAVD